MVYFCTILLMFFDCTDTHAAKAFSLFMPHINPHAGQISLETQGLHVDPRSSVRI